jgi:hypothetical protein
MSHRNQDVAIANGIRVVPIETPTLGDRTYVVHDGTDAFVVDPQRDIDRVLSVLDDAGVQLTHVFETHIHNDYLTGGLALAQRTGASYLVNAEDQVGFDRTPVRDGQTVPVGRMLVTAVSTPGHTFTHLSYTLADESGEHIAVFSRRVAALRLYRPHGPAGRGAHRHPRPPATRLGAHAGRRGARHSRRLSHARVRFVLLFHPVRCDGVDDGA